MRYQKINLKNLIVDEKYSISITEGNGSINTNGWDGVATGANDHSVMLSGDGLQKVIVSIIPLISILKWDANHKHPNCVLANDDFDAGPSQGGGVISTGVGMTTGKWCWEVQTRGQYPAVGVGLKDDHNPDPYNTRAGLWLALLMNYQGGYNYTGRPTEQDFTNNYISSCRVTLAFDADTRKLQWYKDGAYLTESKYTDLPSGPWFATVTTHSALSQGALCTLITNPDDILYPVAGYTLGLP